MFCLTHKRGAFTPPTLPRRHQPKGAGATIQGVYGDHVGGRTSMSVANLRVQGQREGVGTVARLIHARQRLGEGLTCISRDDGLSRRGPGLNRYRHPSDRPKLILDRTELRLNRTGTGH